MENRAVVGSVGSASGADAVTASQGSHRRSEPLSRAWFGRIESSAVTWLLSFARVEFFTARVADLHIVLGDSTKAPCSAQPCMLSAACCQDIACCLVQQAQTLFSSSEI